MRKKRIVVTGMGLVSCLGNDVDQFYQRLLAGESGVRLISSFPCSDWPTHFAGWIDAFDVEDYMEKKQARRVDPFIRYAMVAGKKAFHHSGLKDFHKDRAGIVIGSGMGGMSVFYEGSEALLSKGYKKLTPFFVPFIITNMAGGLLAIDLEFRGPNFSVSTACATASHAIRSAADEIRQGRADVMLAGGAEASITPIGLAGFVSMRALSTRNQEPKRASRPWDTARDGFVMGEGAGVLVLESLEHALERGATIYAEYLGGAVNCDAYHITDPSMEGISRCIELAIEDAGVRKERVNYINAHATSTLAGDKCEIESIKRVFGSHVKKIKINGTKSMTGHCLGAAGGIEAIATIQAIRTRKLHPTINLENPEPWLDGIDVVANGAESCNIDVALSNSFGFGGHNSILAFAPYE